MILPLEAGDAAEFDALRPAIVGGLNRHDNRLLAGAAAASFASVALAAKVGVVHLDAAMEPLALAGDAHDLGELGLDLPRRRLRDAEPPAQLDGGDALLGLGDEVHGTEPGRERQFGVLKDCAGRQRCLSSAGVALVEVAVREDAVLAARALQADEAIRPAPGRQCFTAALLGAIEGRESGLRKTLLKLDAIACHGYLPQRARKAPES